MIMTFFYFSKPYKTRPYTNSAWDKDTHLLPPLIDPVCVNFKVKRKLRLLTFFMSLGSLNFNEIGYKNLFVKGYCL